MYERGRRGYVPINLKINYLGLGRLIIAKRYIYSNMAGGYLGSILDHAKPKIEVV
jgi:hypothetical protein